MNNNAMNAAKTLMYKEAAEAADCVAEFYRRNLEKIIKIAEALNDDAPFSVITCARGSSDHAAVYGKYLIETMIGVPTSSAALSVTSLYTTPLKCPSSLCIAISQSGRSADLLASVQAHQKGGAMVIALVNDETSPLAAMADEVLPLCAGAEKSVAATKSFICALYGLAMLVSFWANNKALCAALKDFPAKLRHAFAENWDAAINDLARADNLFTLGRGYSFGIATEAALKLKETCDIHAEGFSSAEVRHGPMAIIDDGFVIFGFSGSDAAGDGVDAACKDFAERGAKVWLAKAADKATGNNLHVAKDFAIFEPILMIQSFYKMAAQLAVARGLDPDNPPHLKKITNTV